MDLDSEIKELEDKLNALRAEKNKREKIEKLKAEIAIGTGPSSDEQKFCKKMLLALKSNRLILANDVHKYRNIYDNHKEWFKFKGWPDDLRGSSARNFVQSGDV